MNDKPCTGIWRDGVVQIDGTPDWPEGTLLNLIPCGLPTSTAPRRGRVIIAGFGLAGRYVADLLDELAIPFVIVEKNAGTVATQIELGREAVEGDVSTEGVLRNAGIEGATILALTIPDEDAVLKATGVARRLNPDIFIIARTLYTSRGLRAAQLGADEVITAERAVARDYRARLANFLAQCETVAPRDGE